MTKLELINSPIESALRIIMLLNNFKEEQFSLDEIVKLDYYIIHIHDFNSTSESIHPAIPNRENELLTRRKLIIQSIQILESRALIKINYTKTGIRYTTNQLAAKVVEYFETPYAIKLSENIRVLSEQKINEVIFSVESLIKKDSQLWVNKLP